MDEYECTIDFGMVRQRAYAEGDADEWSVEAAAEDDIEFFFERNPDEVIKNLSIGADCEVVGEGEPSEFDEEVDSGIWMQR